MVSRNFLALEGGGCCELRTRQGLSFFMIVFKIQTANEESLEIQFCDSGLYIQIDQNEYVNNIIIANDEVEELIKYLQNHLPKNG